MGCSGAAGVVSAVTAERKEHSLPLHDQRGAGDGLHDCAAKPLGQLSVLIEAGRKRAGQTNFPCAKHYYMIVLWCR